MKIKKIHFVGIKGVGMSPLAIIAKEAGFEVSGSDVSERFITDDELEKAGIEPIVGFSAENSEGADLVIATGAHGGMDNPEVKWAQKKGIKVWNQGEALASFQSGEIFGKDFFGISVAGSHGKTTTTAMIATILKENHLDPSYVIGTGVIPSLDSSGHFGKGKHFIAEADEYVADVVNNRVSKFLYQKPKIEVITNIDFDHPDIFNSMDDIRSVFLNFTQSLPADGLLIMCGDGLENRRFLAQVKVKKITYGFSPDNDYVLEKVNFSSEKMFFWISSGGTTIGEFSTGVFGDHNALNALGAIVVALEVGLSIPQIKKGISVFSGTKRRSEFIGMTPNGATVFDDYAHHPEEIKKTLQAFRKRFPKKKLIVIFQPHMYSRTKKLFDDFTTSFSDADEVVLLEIFPSFREQRDESFSSKLISDRINTFKNKSVYLPTPSDVVKYLSSRNYDQNTVIITMGAGDVYKIGKELINGSR